MEATAAAMEATAATATAERTRVTISGCKADQTSADAWIRDGFYAGALTSNLVENARRAPAGTTYGELIERVRRDMAGKYYQTPQVEGDVDAPLLSAADTGDPAAAVVTWVAGRQVRIGVGWANGVTPGSQFDVFSGGSNDEPAAAEVTVTRVEQDWSQGELTRGVAAPGDRVVRRSHGVTLDRLQVRLECDDDELCRSLRHGLGVLEFVQVTAPDQHYALRLRVGREAGALTAALVFDGVPRVRETAGVLPELVDRLRPHLANAYILERLEGLQNPAPSFRLSLSAYTVASGAALSKDTRGEKVVHARIGDEIRFRFTAERDCYVTLVNVGTSGKVTVLFPNQHRPDGRVRAGQVYETGTAGAMPFRIRASGPPGRELVKAVATLEPLDLASLGVSMMGTRSIEAGERFADSLVRDMAAVYAAGAPGDDSPGSLQQAPLPTTGWSTDHVIVETTR